MLKRGVNMALNMTFDLSTAFSIQEAYSILKPLALFVVAMAIYAIFIFKFYRFLARKDVFRIDLKKYSKAKFALFKKLSSIIAYIVKYLILFPLFVFFWFVILSLLLMLLARNTEAQMILMISMAVVAAVRVSAYYNEDLSKDLAKMIPFALLGVFLVDMSFFSFRSVLDTARQLPSLWKVMAYYLMFTVVLEFVLRIVYSVVSITKPKEKGAG